MDALLKGLHGRECLERVAKQDDGGVATLIHGHLLQRLESEVFADVVGRESLFEHDHLIADLAEPDKEVTVSGGGVDLVAQLGERRFGGLQPFGGGESQQGGPVGGADEFEFGGHSYLSLRDGSAG